MERGEQLAPISVLAEAGRHPLRLNPLTSDTSRRRLPLRQQRLTYRDPSKNHWFLSLIEAAELLSSISLCVGSLVNFSKDENAEIIIIKSGGQCWRLWQSKGRLTGLVGRAVCAGRVVVGSGACRRRAVCVVP